MKVYVLTEIDLQHVGYSPNTIQIFPTHGAAVAEMARMYGEALKKFNTTDDNPANCFDASGYAYVADADYRLDIYECDLDLGWHATESIQEITVLAETNGIRAELMADGTMSRDEVWDLMRVWADEFDESHKGFDYAGHNTSFYDEVDKFVADKYYALIHPYKLCTDPMVSDIILDGNELFGVNREVYVKFHICDGYATADGVRIEYPKVADLTPAQIAEMDEYLGGRIKDSGCVCPEDVALWCGKIVSVTKIMDTLNAHNPELVAKINAAWIEKKNKFEWIMKALYDRDIDEITDHDAFQYKEWLDTMQYEHGKLTGDWSDYMTMALEDMWCCWSDYAQNYLMHIADDGDLETILGFLR